MNRALAHSFPRRKSELRVGPDLLVAAVAAIGTGALLTKHALPIAVVIAGALLVVALAQVSWLSYVLVSASVATVAFYAGWPEVAGIKIPELVLAAALLATAAHFAPNELRAPSVHTWLMLAFLSATAGGVYLGVENGATLDEAVKGMRPMVFYAAFWPALVVAADPRSRQLILRLAGLAVPFLVGLQLAQVQVGLDRPLFAFASTVERVVLTPQADGFLRVRPPALTLTYVATIFAAAYLLWGPGRHRLRVSVVCGAGALGVLLSLNRNMIIGIGLGLTIAALVVPRRKRLLVAALVCSALALTSFSFLQGARDAGATGPIVQRVLSIGDITELRAGTLSDRSYENRFAMSVLKREPLTGIGWGTPYGARLIESRDGRVVNEPRGFMHQQYLWIWMRSGLIGLVSLLVLLGLALASAARWSRKRAWDDESWLGPAVLASGIALIASANVGTYLTNPESIVVLVGVLALAYALRSEAALGEQESVR
jgi:O-antigen ligase